MKINWYTPEQLLDRKDWAELTLANIFRKNLIGLIQARTNNTFPCQVEVNGLTLTVGPNMLNDLIIGIQNKLYGKEIQRS